MICTLSCQVGTDLISLDLIKSIRPHIFVASHFDWMSDQRDVLFQGTEFVRIPKYGQDSTTGIIGLQIPMEKVNLHLDILSDTADKIIEINQQIASITPSEISFGKDANSIPHITLFKGNVTQEDLDRLIKSFPAISPQTGDLPVRLHKPNFGDLDNHYIISRAIDTNLIVALHQYLHNFLDKLNVRTLLSDSSPHLTLAYVNQFSNKLTAYLSDQVPFDVTSNGISLSRAGRRGACVERLISVKLKS